jgi:hypothetical protein
VRAAVEDGRGRVRLAGEATERRRLGSVELPNTSHRHCDPERCAIDSSCRKLGDHAQIKPSAARDLLVNASERRRLKTRLIAAFSDFRCSMISSDFCLRRRERTSGHETADLFLRDVGRFHVGR